jgi:tripartite-type tricarboxylate transporter receptor subunit TctC
MRTLSRRQFASHIPGLAALAAGLPGSAFARPASTTGRLIVGYPPGGTLDTTARYLADAWKRQGRTYIVDNRAGAQGRIANAQLKREKADGSVALCTHTSAMTIYPHVYSKLSYDPTADFRAVSPVASAMCAFAISSMVPQEIKTLAAYTRWVKGAPAAASYASPAAGSMAHFLGFRLQQAGDFKLTHIAYRGSAPAMQDLLGGQIPAYFGFVGDFLPYMETRKLRVLAVSAEKRSRLMPDVPTFGEQGLQQVVGNETYGVFVPPLTPAAEVAAMGEAMRLASKDPALIAGFDKAGLEPITLPPADYASLIAKEREAWKPIVLASGFRSDD